MRIKDFSYARLFFLLLVVLLMVSGCSKDSEKNNHSAFLGGEVVNPVSDQVVLKRNGRILDTLKLDTQNKFSYRIDSLQSELFLFQHYPETQNIFLEPGDSLLLRVNTLAFDESIHFSGIGAERNNFMSEMYLLDEDNADLLLSFYETTPREFKAKADSIRSERLRSLERAGAKNTFSPEFTKLARKIINYESYDLKERYTYLINKYYRKHSKDLPEDFHDYRKQVRFNDRSLQSSPAYKRFISNYLINRSFKWCDRQILDEDDCYSLTDSENIKSRIRMVEDLIQVPSLRRHFLTKLASLGITVARTREEIHDYIQLLEKANYPQEGLDDLKQLGAIQQAFLPGTFLTDVPLVNLRGQSVAIKEVVDGPTIIFLWSMYAPRHRKDHQLIHELRQKYPEINFIGVNLDVGEIESWQMTVENADYKSSHEFQLGPTSVEKRLFKFYLNKLLFLDASGKVIIGDAFINSTEFENRILEFLNR